MKEDWIFVVYQFSCYAIPKCFILCCIHNLTLCNQEAHKSSTFFNLHIILRICVTDRDIYVAKPGSLLSHGHHFYMEDHENMSPCTCSRANTNYKRIASCAKTGFERGPQSLEASPPPTIVPSVLYT